MKQATCAFSLVELSIVLVILGLLVGGILAGQSLIKAAGLRKFAAAHGEMLTKFNTFKDKYFAIPGDMTNASSFWAGQTDGDGNGRVDWNGSEESRFWWHLYLAGLDNTTPISGNYPTPYFRPPGLDNGAAIMYVGTLSTTYASLYAGSAPNNNPSLGAVGLQTAAISQSSWANGASVRPEDAWNVDTKIDDGLPIGGKFTAVNGRRVTDQTTLENCISASAPYTYSLDQTGANCRTMMLLK